MPLQRILASLDSPVRPEVTSQIITYMHSIPASGKEQLIEQCFAHLENTQTLGVMLASVHALNGGKFLLLCHTEVNENELAEDFAALFGDDDKKKQITAPPE